MISECLSNYNAFGICHDARTLEYFIEFIRALVASPLDLSDVFVAVVIGKRYRNRPLITGPAAHSNPIFSPHYQRIGWEEVTPENHFQDRTLRPVPAFSLQPSHSHCMLIICSIYILLFSRFNASRACSVRIKIILYFWCAASDYQQRLPFPAEQCV